MGSEHGRPENWKVGVLVNKMDKIVTANVFVLDSKMRLSNTVSHVYNFEKSLLKVLHCNFP